MHKIDFVSIFQWIFKSFIKNFKMIKVVGNGQFSNRDTGTKGHNTLGVDVIKNDDIII